MDSRDRYEERMDFLAALEELDKLPERLRAVVLVRSQVRAHAEVAEVLGISKQRVAFLLQHVTVALREISERRLEGERPVASPRAARLRELEDDPPSRLVGEIGHNGGRGKSDAGRKLAWRRAALAIDDYRRVSGWDSPSEAIGSTLEPAAVRARQRAERAIGHLREERQRRYGLSRDR